MPKYLQSRLQQKVDPMVGEDSGQDWMAHMCSESLLGMFDREKELQLLPLVEV